MYKNIRNVDTVLLRYKLKFESYLENVQKYSYCGYSVFMRYKLKFEHYLENVQNRSALS